MAKPLVNSKVRKGKGQSEDWRRWLVPQLQFYSIRYRGEKAKKLKSCTQNSGPKTLKRVYFNGQTPCELKSKKRKGSERRLAPVAGPPTTILLNKVPGRES